MNSPSKEELQRRIRILQELLKTKDISGVFILQNVDLYYYTGTSGPVCFYIPAAGTPVYFSRQRGELPADLPWPVSKFNRWSEVAAHIQDMGYYKLEKIGLENDVIPAAVYLKMKETFPGSAVIDIGPMIRQQRAVKSPWEISIMRETARRDQGLWEMIPELLHLAKTDLELTALFEAEAKKHGHMGILRLRGFNMEMSLACVLADERGTAISFIDTPLSGTGTSPAFPFGASGAVLEPGKPILIDYGGCYSGYIIDQTRMFILNNIPEKIKYTYDKSLEIQEELIAATSPGITCGELYDRAKALATKAGMEENFMGAAGGVSFVGHGVGLEVDELPVLARGSRQIIEEGMVLAIEPKFVLAGIGAVGIENCFAVTSQGLDRLSEVSDELIVV